MSDVESKLGLQPERQYRCIRTCMHTLDPRQLYGLCKHVQANLRVNVSDGTPCLVGQLVDESGIGHSCGVVHGCANGDAFRGREERKKT